MSDKKELKRKSLSELKALIPQSVAGLQNYGGGDGSYGNPYSEAEYNALVIAGYFTGGYVELDGEVLWSLAPAYCGIDSGPGSNWVNVLLSYASATFDAGGQVAQQSPWTVRFTNSIGHVDFRCYTTGWLGNQYVNNYQPFGAGKVMRVGKIGEMLSRIGNVLGAANLVVDFYQLLSSQSSSETWSALLDLTADTIFFVSGTYGLPFSILYTSGLGDQIKAIILDCMEN